MMRKRRSPTLGLSQQSIYHHRAELVYFGASLVITATAPKQGDRLDPALPALYHLDCAASIVIDDSPHGLAAVGSVEMCGKTPLRSSRFTQVRSDERPRRCQALADVGRLGEVGSRANAGRLEARCRK
jgi:hypothetical protein